MRLLAAALLVGFDVTVVLAGTVVSFVPPGLNPGDTYHVAFITDGTRDAISDDIAVYNAFVQSQAEMVGAITENWHIDWFAIASTEDVDARDNAVVSSPVFLLDGTLIATGLADFWDGNIASALDTSQFGNTPELNPGVWTGSFSDGTESFNIINSSFGPIKVARSLGSSFNIATIGSGLQTGVLWIDIGFAGNPSTSASKNLYALSETLTVGSIVPEPSSHLLSLAGVLLIGGYGRRGRVYVRR